VIRSFLQSVTHRIHRTWSIRFGLALILTAFFTVPSAPYVHAQSESQQLKRFRQADQYLRAGNVEEAIDILESLHQSSPGKASFYRKLKEAYESVKRYEDALRLLDGRMGENPRPSQLSEKARLLYLNGEEEAASQTWDDAIALAPEQPSTYRVVYQTLVEIRRFKDAIAILREARTTLDNEALFRTELAYLYGLDGQHRNAMREYVAMLSRGPERLALVRNRLQSFVEQGEGIESSIEVLTTAVENSPLNPAYRELLAWLYMKTDRYDEAYDVYRALDRLQKQKGKTLFTFGQKAADANKFAVATSAYEAILKHHPEASVAADAQRALGHAYRQWAETTTTARQPEDSTSRYDSARTAYDAFLHRFSSHEAAPEVRTELGLLELDVYRDLDAAESTLQRVVSDHPKTQWANEARYALARIGLLRGDINHARVLFSRLANRLRSGDLADQARFELALLQFYEGNFDAALSRAKATSENTSADVTNDAIELSVLIQENRGPDSLNTPLRTYARAQLLRRQHRYDEALGRLDSLMTRHPRHSLVDDATFQRAEIALSQGDTTRAEEAFAEIPDRHPRSPYADRSLFRLATVYETQGQTDSAVRTYNLLLTEYPKSLFAGDARSRLRALEVRS